MRPSRAESVELERLEVAAGKIAGALELLAIVALRFDQVLRRAPRLRALVSKGQRQVATAVRDLDDAHQLLCTVLDAKQAARSAAHAASLRPKGDTG